MCQLVVSVMSVCHKYNSKIALKETWNLLWFGLALISNFCMSTATKHTTTHVNHKWLHDYLLFDCKQ